jgi:hypothetical protein
VSRRDVMVRDERTNTVRVRENHHNIGPVPAGHTCLKFKHSKRLIFLSPSFRVFFIVIEMVWMMMVDHKKESQHFVNRQS